MQEVRGSNPLISTNYYGHLGGLFFFMGKLIEGFTERFLFFGFFAVGKSSLLIIPIMEA